MAARNTGEILTDEQRLIQENAAAKEAILKLEKEFNDLRQQNEKILNKSRKSKKEMRNLQEEVEQNSMALEKFRTERDKFVFKIDKKVINKKIDSKSEEIFEDFIEGLADNEVNIEIEVKSEHTRAKFNFKDAYKFANESNDIMNSSEIVFMRKKGPKTFGDMKNEVAPLVLLQPKDFFFADSEGFVFLDDLPVLGTLLPTKQKVRKSVLSLSIIHKNNSKFDDLILEKIKEDFDEPAPRHSKHHKVESKEEQEMALAMKEIENTKAKMKKYYQRKNRHDHIYKTISALIFIAVTGTWLGSIFNRYDYEEEFAMRNAIRDSLESTYNQTNPNEFFEALSVDLATYFTSQDSALKYSFLSLNHFYSPITFVLRKFEKVPCEYTNSYMNYYYSKYDASCIAPTSLDKSPIIINGVSYKYEENPEDQLQLPIFKGDFDNSGHRLFLTVNNESLLDQNIDLLHDFYDDFAGHVYSFNFAIYNPSLSKLACVYRVTHEYNYETIQTESFIYVFEVSSGTRKSTTLDIITISIAALLLLINAFSIVYFISDANEDLDTDLLWRKMKKQSENSGATILKKDEDDTRYFKASFWTARLCGFRLKIEKPQFVYFLNLITIIILVVEIILDLVNARLLSTFDLKGTQANGQCAQLVKVQYISVIFASILIILLMLTFLRYLSEFFNFIARFVNIVRQLVKNAYTIGFLLIWLLLTLSLFGNYTVGSYFPYLSSYSQFYAAVILMLMKKNVVFSNQDDLQSYNNMKINIGSFPFVAIIVFIYIVFTLTILKIVTAIVIRSIKEANEKTKIRVQDSRIRYERAINFISKKIFEDVKARLKKQ